MPSLAVALLDLGGLVITGYLCDLTSQAPHTLACVPSHYRWRISWAPGPHLCPVTDYPPPAPTKSAEVPSPALGLGPPAQIY